MDRHKGRISGRRSVIVEWWCRGCRVSVVVCRYSKVLDSVQNKKRVYVGFKREGHATPGCRRKRMEAKAEYLACK